LRILGYSVVLLILLIAFDQLALWAERRGWIYYRKKNASPGSLGSALLESHAILEPRVNEVVEASAEQVPEHDVGADPPESSSEPDSRVRE
jgi:hypothetical protein